MRFSRNWKKQKCFSFNISQWWQYFVRTSLSSSDISNSNGSSSSSSENVWLNDVFVESWIVTANFKQFSAQRGMKRERVLKWRRRKKKEKNTKKTIVENLSKGNQVWSTVLLSAHTARYLTSQSFCDSSAASWKLVCQITKRDKSDVFKRVKHYRTQCCCWFVFVCFSIFLLLFSLFDRLNLVMSKTVCWIKLIILQLI